MEPEVQKFASVALVGLLAFFPVFNQVKDTALEALTDADHKAEWGSFFKDWDDIPADEKLEYWGGGVPPGGSGDFDRDRLDDDFTTGGQPGDRDDDGVPDEEDADPDDPEVGRPQRYRWVEEKLWSQNFSNSTTQEESRPERIGRDGISYGFVNVSWAYESFTGYAEFILEVDGARQCCTETAGSRQVPAVNEDDDQRQSVPQVETLPMEWRYVYEPQLNAPQSFTVNVTGAYKVPVEDAPREAA